MGRHVQGSHEHNAKYELQKYAINHDPFVRIICIFLVNRIKRKQSHFILWKIFLGKFYIYDLDIFRKEIAPFLAFKNHSNDESISCIIFYQAVQKFRKLKNIDN